jgi:hypothetical protein
VILNFISVHAESQVVHPGEHLEILMKPLLDGLYELVPLNLVPKLDIADEHFEFMLRP